MPRQVTGWLRNTVQNPDRVEIVDISPRGEEGMHIADPECECGPRVSRDTEGRPMIIHNSWDGREGFERAAAKLPESYRGRMAA